MAPEVKEGIGYSFKVDIWSSGIIMYRLIANKFPFTQS